MLPVLLISDPIISSREPTACAAALPLLSHQIMNTGRKKNLQLKPPASIPETSTPPPASCHPPSPPYSPPPTADEGFSSRTNLSF